MFTCLNLPYPSVGLSERSMVSRSGEDGDNDWGDSVLGEGHTSSRSAPGVSVGGEEVELRLPWDRKRRSDWPMFRQSIRRLSRRRMREPAHGETSSFFNTFNTLTLICGAY